MPRATLPARRLIVALTIVLLGTAACGSSSKSSASSTTTTTPAAGSTSTSAPAAATPTTAGESFSGSSDSSFCNEIRDDEAAFRSTDIATKTPPQVKALYANLAPKLESAAANAPRAIKGDFATFVSAYQRLAKVLAAAQYNFENLDPTTISTLDTPQVQVASNRIQQYMSQVCKITTTTT